MVIKEKIKKTETKRPVYVRTVSIDTIKTAIEILRMERERLNAHAKLKILNPEGIHGLKKINQAIDELEPMIYGE